MRPRIRTLKPDTWESEQLGSVSRDARLLFVGIITYADDEGRFKSHPGLLKSHVFPLDEEVTQSDVQIWLLELAHAGLVRLYQWQGVSCGHLPTWEKHQKVNRPTPSDLPAPPDTVEDPPPIPETQEETSTSDTFTEASLNAHGEVSDGREGKGREGIRKGRDTYSSEPAGASAEREGLTLVPLEAIAVSVGGFPTVGKVRTWDLTEQEHRDLQESYPGVDVMKAALEARQWCRSNKAKRKTAAGMSRFLNSWMAKRQNATRTARDRGAEMRSALDAWADGEVA